MVSQTQISNLESLHQVLLGDILSRVAQSSREEIQQCMQVSPTLTRAVDDYRVYKNLNLRHLAMNPLETVDNFQPLMKICLRNRNAEAHYIEGVKEYFLYNNTNTGLHHLQQSADGHYDEGIYLYAIVMLCRGNREEGKRYMDMLGWKECKKKADRSWRHNKLALRDIGIVKKRRYRAAVRNNQPPTMTWITDATNASTTNK